MPKKGGLRQFADLRGAIFEGAGGGVDTPIHTMWGPCIFAWMIVTFKYFLPIDLKQNLKYLLKVQSFCFSLDASMMACHVQEYIYIYEYIKLYLNVTKLKSKSGDHLIKQKSEKI